ncbi:MAG: hypothetical protein KGN77_02110 [Xanthomonadaceae bacterium]|nr:hypothetical protein [Xanthomonadaceae bacterium]
MLAIDVTSDLARFAKDLDYWEKRQLPYAARLTINEASREALETLRQQLPKIFDRPTPWTMHGFYYVPCGKDRQELQARIGIKFNPGSGTPAEKYLGPEIIGGPRNVKRFEKALAFSQIAPVNATTTVPGLGAPLDQYGNVPSGQIVRMLADLRALDRSGSTGNASDRSLKRRKKRGLLTRYRGQMTQYFVAKSKQDGAPLGVWKFLGRGIVVPFLVFTRRAPTYRPIFDFAGILTKRFADVFPKMIAGNLDKAMRSAKW